MKYTILVERDESGFYVASVKELPGCFTQAKTLRDLIARTLEAIDGYKLSKRVIPCR